MDPQRTLWLAVRRALMLIQDELAENPTWKRAVTIVIHAIESVYLPKKHNRVRGRHADTSMPTPD